MLLFLLGSTLVQNWQTEVQFQEFAKGISLLEAENKNLLADFYYNQSPQAEDKHAKETLKLVQPGEMLIILTASEINTYEQQDPNTTLDWQTQMKHRSKREQWRSFFFQSAL